MDISQLKFDNGRVKSALKVLDDNSVMCTEHLTCMFPKRFIEISLANIGADVECIGCLGFITDDGHYFSMLISATYHLSPSSIRETNIDGVRYVVLDFDKGDTVFKNKTVVQDAHLNNKFFDEFSYYAKTPWYINYKLVNSMLDRAKHITGRGVANSPQVSRILYAIGQRDPDDYSQPYRYSKAILEGRPPHLEGLNNVSMLIDGTFNKLIGGYDKDTMIDALLTVDTKVTTNEIIMKGGKLE